MRRLLGGHPVLDFINTIDPREGDRKTDYLRSFDDLIQWAQRTGVLRREEARRAMRAAAHDPSAGRRAFVRAIELREACHAIFSAVAAHRRWPSDAVRVLENAFRNALASARLTPTESSAAWRVAPGLDIVRWQIARAAVGLLESGPLDRIKRCPGSGNCGWLFLDSSKNASRRWCSMEGCGNRAKVRRYSARLCS